MATVEETIEILKKLEEQGNATAKTLLEGFNSGKLSGSDLLKFGENLTASTSKAMVFSDAVQKAKDRAGEFYDRVKTGFGDIDLFGKLTDDSNSFVNTLNNIKDNISEFNESSGGVLSEGLSVAFTVANANIVKNSSLWGQLGDSGAEAATKLSTNFQEISAIASKLGVPQEVVSAFVKQNEAVIDLQNSYYKMALANGVVNKEFGSSAELLSKSREGAAAFAKTINDVALASGAAPSQIGPLLAELGQKIPTALRQTSLSANDTTESVLSVMNAYKVASGIGMSFKDMNDKLGDSYARFGNSIDKTITNLVLYNKAAQDTGIRQTAVLDFINKTNQGMESMADSTESATIMISSLGKVMKDLQFSDTGISNILSGMVSGAKGMDIGTASFISGASGGRGGLAGGFEIELLKQQGNFGEIINRTMQAMEKIGVQNPVTLQDVQNNPELAGELLKQRELIKQFGLAQNDQDAYRVLEAMQKGAQDELAKALSEQKDPQEATTEAIKAGIEVQKMGNQFLSEINAKISAGQGVMALQTYGFSERIDEKVDNVLRPKGMQSGNSIIDDYGKIDTLKDMYSGNFNKDDYTKLITSEMGNAASSIAAVFKESFTESIQAVKDAYKNSTSQNQQNISQKIEITGKTETTIVLEDSAMREIARVVSTTEIEQANKSSNAQSFTGTPFTD